MSAKPPVTKLIESAWDKTKGILFPFQFKRWLRILLIVWLAGQAGSGGGGNFNVPQTPQQQEVATDELASDAQDGASQDAPETPFAAPQAGGTLDDTTGIPQGLLGQTQEGNGAQAGLPDVPTWLIVVLVPIFLALMFVFMWLSARFNFIYLDLVTRRDISIRESFKEHKALGNSYFKFSLGVLFLVLLVGGGLVALFFVPVTLWVTIPLFVLFVVALIVIGTFIIDFVLPMMFQDKSRTMEGCRKFLALKPSIGSLSIYLLVKMGLGLAAGMIALVVGILVAIGVFIVGLVVAIPGALLGSAVPALNTVLIALGVLLLIVAVLAMVVLIGLVTLPIPIFFRTFSVLYLHRLFPDYNLLGYSSPDSP